MKTINAFCAALCMLLFADVAHAEGGQDAESKRGIDNLSEQSIEIKSDLTQSPDYQYVTEDQEATFITKSEYQLCQQVYPSNDNNKARQ